jgi:Leucine-rich repeat (LRR) protein
MKIAHCSGSGSVTIQVLSLISEFLSTRECFGGMMLVSRAMSHGARSHVKTIAFPRGAPDETAARVLQSVRQVVDVSISYIQPSAALSEAFRSLGCLRTLHVAHMRPLLSADLLDNMFQGHSLLELSLNNCFIKSIPDAIEGLASLRVMNFTDIKMRTLPSSIGRLKELEIIKLIYCPKLVELPETITSLSKLKRIDVRFCSAVEELPASIEKLTSLTELNVKGSSRIRTLPVTIGGMTALRILNVSHTKLGALPETIGGMASLRALNVSHTDIRTLPETFGSLVSLIDIDLKHCASLVELPASFGGLLSLGRMDITNCSSLERFPVSMGDLPRLKRVDACTCRSLGTIPESFWNITSLDHVSFNSVVRMDPMSYSTQGALLSSVPGSIRSLVSLRTLNLAGCRWLESLPETIGDISQLTSLDVSCTAISTIPSTIGRLTSLKALRAMHTNIEHLPDETGNLLSLETLALSGCSNLATIPPSVYGLPNLKTLLTDNCPSLDARLVYAANMYRIHRQR